MNLYLIRHAHAVDAQDNAERPLSPKGQRQIATLVRFFQDRKPFAPKEVWHSALARSLETAVALERDLHWEAPLVQVPDLEPEDNPEKILSRLRDFPGNLVIVGHEPHLGSLATLLLAGKSGGLQIELKKGAVLALAGKGKRWELRWLVAPALVKDPAESAQT